MQTIYYNNFPNYRWHQAVHCLQSCPAEACNRLQEHKKMDARVRGWVCHLSIRSINKSICLRNQLVTHHSRLHLRHPFPIRQRLIWTLRLQSTIKDRQVFMVCMGSSISFTQLEVGSLRRPAEESLSVLFRFLLWRELPRPAVLARQHGKIIKIETISFLYQFDIFYVDLRRRSLSAWHIKDITRLVPVIWLKVILLISHWLVASTSPVPRLRKRIASKAMKNEKVIDNVSFDVFCVKMKSWNKGAKLKELSCNF